MAAGVKLPTMNHRGFVSSLKYEWFVPSQCSAAKSVFTNASDAGILKEELPSVDRVMWG